MLAGIGIDMVHIPRIERGLARFKDRYARRILTDNEYAEYIGSARPERFLAKRYAAKEAVAKAIGTGIRGLVTFQDIEVAHNELGRPMLVFSVRMREYLRSIQVGDGLISLTDEHEYAVAYVTLLSNEPR